MTLHKDCGTEPESTTGSCAALTTRALQPFTRGETGAEDLEELYPKTSPSPQNKKKKSDLHDMTEWLHKRANSPSKGTFRYSQTTRILLDPPAPNLARFFAQSTQPAVQQSLTAAVSLSNHSA